MTRLADSGVNPRGLATHPPRMRPLGAGVPESRWYGLKWSKAEVEKMDKAPWQKERSHGPKIYREPRPPLPCGVEWLGSCRTRDPRPPLPYGGRVAGAGMSMGR